MSSVEAEPASTYRPTQPQEPAPDVAPQLPSRWWPVFVILTIVVALGFQTRGLLSVMAASGKEAEFVAQMAAWETASEDRQKALDTWTQLQSDVDAEVGRLRETSAKLKANTEQMKAEQAQTRLELARAQEELSALETKIDLGNQGFQATRATHNQLQLEIKSLNEEKSTLNGEISKLASSATSATTKLETLKESVALQEQLLDSNKTRYETLDQRIAQIDRILSGKTETAAKLKVDQERLVALTEEREKLQREVEAVQTRRESLEQESQDLAKQVAIARMSLKESTSEATQAETEKARLEMEIANLETSLERLRKQDLNLNKQLADMTEAMNSVALNAADSLKDLAAKAAEVRAAIASMQIPAPPKTEIDAPSPMADTSEEEPE